MISHFTLMRLVLLSISLGLCTTTFAAKRLCGDRIQSKDVLAVDLESYAGQEDLFYKKLQEQAGTSILITRVPVPVRSTGNNVANIQTAKRSAAGNGCDLVVLLGYATVETRWQGTVIHERKLMVHLGIRETP